jgi:uncharacterized cupredoxin-like copper-binding protein
MFKFFGMLTAVLLLSGLALSHARAANVTVIRATVQEFKIELSPTSVPVGTPVRFEVANLGKLKHEFVVEKAGAVDQHLTEEVEGKETESEIEAFDPGETETLDWTFNESGVYQAACHLPNHFQAGMLAAFIVTPSSPGLLPTAGGVGSGTSFALISLGGALLVLGGFGLWIFVKR